MVTLYFGRLDGTPLPMEHLFFAVYAAGGGKRNMANFAREDKRSPYNSVDVFLHMPADGIDATSTLEICRLGSNGEWVCKPIGGWDGLPCLKLQPDWFKTRFWDNRQAKNHPWFTFRLLTGPGAMVAPPFAVHQYYPQTSNPNHREYFMRAVKPLLAMMDDVTESMCDALLPAMPCADGQHDGAALCQRGDDAEWAAPPLPLSMPIPIPGSRPIPIPVSVPVSGEQGPGMDAPSGTAALLRHRNLLSHRQAISDSGISSMGALSSDYFSSSPISLGDTGYTMPLPRSYGASPYDTSPLMGGLNDYSDACSADTARSLEALGASDLYGAMEDMSLHGMDSMEFLDHQVPSQASSAPSGFSMPFPTPTPQQSRAVQGCLHLDWSCQCPRCDGCGDPYDAAHGCQTCAALDDCVTHMFWHQGYSA